MKKLEKREDGSPMFLFLKKEKKKRRSFERAPFLKEIPLGAMLFRGAKRTFSNRFSVYAMPVAFRVLQR